ncbi:MAG: tRNA glutamyl-Q(34) synthetase GluQRS [Thermoleophilaceae bacterium]|nr:tRNA glutamyl-Q(34) synthetase GluQRS [Thermoleophilaceae bacterium]
MSSDGRYAPSPTGALHLGNLRTAMIAWLFARSAGARFLMRIDDLDPQRSRREWEQRQLGDLNAIGVDWDGPVVRQSERRARHIEAIERLKADGCVYRCWCTRTEIREAASAAHGPLPEGAYPGTCRRLSASERFECQMRGRPPALRLDAGGEQVEFEDRLHGTVSGWVDDFVLQRGDGTPAYNLAVVVDDLDQGIGEVVRGEDLLDSTARQVLLSRLLGLPSPGYAHVPLVLGADGARLAKRHGAITLAGMPAERAREWIADSLGGISLDPADFDPDALPRMPTTFGGL